MKRTAAVIRHIHFEDLGTLGPLLLERGHTVRYVDPALEDLAALDALAPDLLVCSADRSGPSTRRSIPSWPASYRWSGT